MKNKKICIFALIFFLIAISIIFSACQDEELIKFTVKYFVTDGGKVNITWTQRISYGEDAMAVTATANNGYKFVKWSDTESTDPQRRDENVTKNISATAMFEKMSYAVEYLADENGTISGTACQSVVFEAYSTSVTAVPKTGYMFVKWTDDNTSATRNDKITSNFSVTAIFEKLEKTYTYMYNNASSGNTTKNVTLKFETFNEVNLTVPTKEHFTFDGWCIDKEKTIQVSDEFGNLTIGTEIFDYSSDTLYAKWTANENFTYKVLMVYVTRFEATLTTANGITRALSYTMSETERQICELITIQIQKTLNEIFDGLVTFELDSYFTTEVVGAESLTKGVGSTGKWSYDIFAKDIPEIRGLLKDYRSVITTVSKDDYDGLFYSGASGIKKYACIHLENLLLSFRINNVPIETLLDAAYHGWEFISGLYIHEFTHTVEQYYGYGNVYEYHKFVSYFWKDYGQDSVGTTQWYLTNNAYINGERVGIPYEFWKGELPIYIYTDYTLTTKIIEMSALGNTLADILDKIDYLTEREGYEFVGWLFRSSNLPVSPDYVVDEPLFIYAAWERKWQQK